MVNVFEEPTDTDCQNYGIVLDEIPKDPGPG